MNRTLDARARDLWKKAGQGHVLARLDALSAGEQAKLVSELSTIDLGLLARLRSLALAGERAAPVAERRFEPPEVFPLARGAALRERAQLAAAHGRELCARGKLGFVLVAGGQASRLGLPGPKGAVPVGPVTGRSLFEIHARRLLRLARSAGVRTPWYVMTSPANDAETRAVFERAGSFGLRSEDVFFFAQEMLPALDPSGRVLFAAQDALFRAPSGHGGVLSGLARSGALDDMGARGIEVISYFQVDNPLARPVDALFLGLHELSGAGMSSKVVSKRDALEKVGVIGKIDGRMGCIEYSDLPSSLRDARDDAGALRFGAGNIAVHLLDAAFLRSITQGSLELPWHVAKKKMQVADEHGALVERSGFKFESFVFDALALSETSVTLEVERALEFSPLKNSTGEDSPASCRRDLCTLHARWVRRAGLPLPTADASGLHPVEIDPLLAETEEEFQALEGPKPHVTPDGHFYSSRG